MADASISILDLIGKRVLLRATGRYTALAVEEYKVLEVSPSGQWVRLMNTHGNKFWKPVTDISLVEVLREIRPEAPPLN